MKAILLPVLLVAITFGASLSAQEVTKASDLAKKWKRTKSLAEPKLEVRRTKSAVIGVNVDADTQERFNNLQFALDSDKLEGATTFLQLAEIASAMKMAGTEKFLIEGHTCDLGSEAHNVGLSQKRAAAVIAELVRLGVSADRLQPMGFGAEQPLVENTSEPQRARNRRVQIFRKV